jgi:hypothetical protein
LARTLTGLTLSAFSEAAHWSPSRAAAGVLALHALLARLRQPVHPLRHAAEAGGSPARQRALRPCRLARRNTLPACHPVCSSTTSPLTARCLPADGRGSRAAQARAPRCVAGVACAAPGQAAAAQRGGPQHARARARQRRPGLIRGAHCWRPMWEGSCCRKRSGASVLYVKRLAGERLSAGAWQPPGRVPRVARASAEMHARGRGHGKRLHLVARMAPARRLAES